MSIKIDKNKCIGCGKCTNVCPGTLNYLDEDKKAFIKYPKDCWGCTACVKACPVAAISYYLGAEIGGREASLTASDQEDKVIWKIKNGSETTEIVIDRKESNKY